MNAELDHARRGQAAGALAERARGHRQDHAHPPPPGRPHRRPRAVGQRRRGRDRAPLRRGRAAPRRPPAPRPGPRRRSAGRRRRAAGRARRAGGRAPSCSCSTMHSGWTTRPPAPSSSRPTAPARPGARRAGHPRPPPAGLGARRPRARAARGPAGRGDRRAGRDRGRRRALPRRGPQRCATTPTATPCTSGRSWPSCPPPSWPTPPGSCPRPARSPRSCWCASPSSAHRRRASCWPRPCSAPACALADAVALAAVPDPLGGLDEAVKAGLLTEALSDTGHDVVFAHELVRAAVYADLSPARRHALHRAAAAKLDGDVALQHRIAAAVGPDTELATELADARPRRPRRPAMAAGRRPPRGGRGAVRRARPSARRGSPPPSAR